MTPCKKFVLYEKKKPGTIYSNQTVLINHLFRLEKNCVELGEDETAQLHNSYNINGAGILSSHT
jgi:hypothetical protein